MSYLSLTDTAGGQRASRTWHVQTAGTWLLFQRKMQVISTRKRNESSESRNETNLPRIGQASFSSDLLHLARCCDYIVLPPPHYRTPPPSPVLPALSPIDRKSTFRLSFSPLLSSRLGTQFANVRPSRLSVRHAFCIVVTRLSYSAAAVIAPPPSAMMKLTR